MIMTVDIGNSRIKWAVWQADKIIIRAAAAYQIAKCDEVFDFLYADIKQQLSVLGFEGEGINIGIPSQVYAVSVANELVREKLCVWVRNNWRCDVTFLATQKSYKHIVNAYDDPQQHGADRWAGIVAACIHNPGIPVCVISAGTAITFDLVDRDGTHLGGYILPSYMTMHNALLTDTANVQSTTVVKYSHQPIPISTDDGVNQGLHIMLQAGIRELCRQATSRLGAAVQFIITGGSAGFIRDYPDMPDMKLRQDLVMQGIYVILKQQGSSNR